MDSKKNTIDSLIEQGQANGKLTTKEITDALEELDFDVDQMEQKVKAVFADIQAPAADAAVRRTGCCHQQGDFGLPSREALESIR